MIRETKPPPERKSSAWLAALALIVPVMAISGQSFWIDEASTCWKAQQPAIGQWWSELVAERGSDLQMPAYQFFMWLWVKAVGTSEVALRVANLPWFWLGLLAVWRGLASVPGIAKGFILAMVINPLCWYYLNDARPYAMQVAMAAVVLAALWRLGSAPQSDGPLGWFWVLCGGALALAGSSMLGMIFCGAYLLAGGLVFGGRRSRQLLQANAFASGVMAVGFLALGVYFLWTMKLGAGGMKIRADLRNVIFVVYEMLGFSGLGPGRTEIRTGAMRSFLPFTPVLAIFGVGVAVVGWAGMRRLYQTMAPRAFVSFLVIVGAAVVFLFGVGFILKFRVLGRHFIPILPMVSLCFGAGLLALWERRRGGRLLAAAYLALALASCLQLRLAARHAKDDYRNAAGLARQVLARGETIWWNAELRGAQVYSVPYSLSSPASGKAWVIPNPSAGFAEGAAKPDWVVVSKPDIYDLHGSVAAFLIHSGYGIERQMPAFSVWKKTR